MSLSCCQTASKVHWAAFYADVFLPICFFCTYFVAFSSAYCSFCHISASPGLCIPLTGTVGSLWELQGKEREQHFTFISFSVEKKSLAQLSLFFFTRGKASTVSVYLFRPNTMVKKSADVGAQSLFVCLFSISHYWPLMKLLLVVKHWTQQLCIAAIPSLVAVGTGPLLGHPSHEE